MKCTFAKIHRRGNGASHRCGGDGHPQVLRMGKRTLWSEFSEASILSGRYLVNGTLRTKGGTMYKAHRSTPGKGPHAANA